MKPYFSVVIPTLNEEKYLPKLLNDLSKQTEKDFEVIVVDGRSDDQTVKKAKKFKNKLTLRIIYSNKRNLCFQRNLGAEKSLGNYLIFMDADIGIYKNYLSVLKETINKNSYLFLTTYQLPDTNDQIDVFLSQMANYGLEILKIINKQMAPGYNFVIYKDIFIKIGGFNVKTTISEDHELSIRLLRSGVRLNIVPRRLLRWSFRRFKKDGRLPIIVKYGFASLYTILFGKITDKKLSYQMGGQYFLTKKNDQLDKKIEKELMKYYSKISKTLRKVF